MESKEFKSRLFKRKIESDNPDYWNILYAEILFRLREIDDLYCFCEHCQLNTDNLNRIIKALEKDGHIEENHKPRNFAGQGFCSKKLQEDSERSARAYSK